MRKFLHYAHFLPALFALSASCAFAQSPIFKDTPPAGAADKSVLPVPNGESATESGGENKQISFASHAREARKERAALRARLEQKKQAAKNRLEKVGSAEGSLSPKAESVPEASGNAVPRISEAEAAASRKAQRLENKKAIAKAKADAAKKAEAARAAEDQSRPSAENAKSGSVFDSIFPF